MVIDPLINLGGNMLEYRMLFIINSYIRCIMDNVFWVGCSGVGLSIQKEEDEYNEQEVI